MKQENNRKKSVGILVGALLVAVAIFLGVSYAYFTFSQTLSQSNYIRIGSLEIAVASEANAISLASTSPTTATYSLRTTPYEFTIKNKGSKAVTFDLSMENITSSSCENCKVLPTDGVAYQLEDVTDGVSYGPGSLSADGSSVIGTLMTDTLLKGQSKTYQLWIWLDDTKELDERYQDANFYGKITATAAFTKKATTTLLAKANSASVTSYQNGDTKEMYCFSHEAPSQLTTWTDAALADYRYIGSNPSNYVRFNEELWRIVGVFMTETPNEDGTYQLERRVKLVRDTSIGSYAWDSSVSSVNSGNGVNYFADADLMKLLNQDAYFQRTTGTCIIGTNNGTASCDFSSVGLNETAKTLLSPVKWYLGGYYNTALSGGDAYASERGTAIYTTSSDATRQIYWASDSSRVGLLYPSDYAYTFALGVDDTCYQDLSLCGATNSWLVAGNQGEGQWTIMSSAATASEVLIIDSQGKASSSSASQSYGVRPTVYLDADVNIVSGTGTSGDPYILGK